ncbi:type II pantothenate kinase [Paenibacillus sp. BSR1-1]|uniref:type II pantothenate kinase n=1 Tax=Paenibacillus sp. BSR1-1 TaxID=3020845 RepID=UPI0025B1E980|nr:type II pantothenate kinase [Paenibacillus sp. BSR1-1]MDN3017067.1 type II pantothenate kinase [Paenibacillus sp. BSR1-1]
MKGLTLQKAGIDAGGSLMKIVYQENNKKHYKKYPINQINEAVSWLKIAAPNLSVGLTGGKAHLIQKKYLHNAVLIPEFQATCEGARILMLEEKKRSNQHFLIVNIGTGTSWHLVAGEKYERILGSGIGGGTFIGLGSLLTKKEDFQDLIHLANKGEKENIDLLVKDIYESAEPPIDGHLTAANFAKGLKVKHSDADRMAAVTNMIAETIALLTLQAAAIHQVKSVVLIGSTLIGNESLTSTLEYYLKRFELEAVFLGKGEYCGAVGAYDFV